MQKTFDYINYSGYDEILNEDLIKWIYIYNIIYPIIQNCYDDKPEIINMFEQNSLYKKINNDPIKSIALYLTFIIIINT